VFIWNKNFCRLLVFRIVGLCIVGFPREQVTAAELSAAQCLIHRWEGQFIVRCMAGWLVSDLRCHSSCWCSENNEQRERDNLWRSFVLSISPSSLWVKWKKKKSHFTAGISPLKLCESLTALTHTHTHVVVKLPLKKKERVNFLSSRPAFPRSDRAEE
jgi:hypothetical protein